LILGNSTTQQWFDGGFLTYPGIDPTRWELIAVAHHYVGAWADGNDTAWTTPLDGGHACAQGAQTPDRVIFIVTQSPPYPPESTYQTQTTSVVQNIRAKYPGARQIALATLIRSPGNAPTACSAVTDNEQSIPAAEDQAIASVAAAPAFAGVVVALPPFYVPSCGDFVADHPQYTTAVAADIAEQYGAYFAAHP
jgi:predicted NAD/FAD-dependent oxidoreductase